MKRDDEIKNGKYEWESEYHTNEKPFSTSDKLWILLFRAVLIAGAIYGSQKLIGISYSEIFHEISGFL